MSNSSIPQQVRERIQKEAEKAIPKLVVDAPDDWQKDYNDSVTAGRRCWIAGAESEYLRTQDQGWVSVKERLPELIGDERYDQKSSRTLLVYAAGIYFGQYRVPNDGRKKSFWVDPTDESILYVTHWRELPPPPQNENGC